MTSQEMKKTLWEAADKLRAQMDAAEYKHLVLGLIFLKYVSDSFDERRREVARLLAEPTSDLYFTDDTAEQAKASKIGKLLDEALIAIEDFNPSLKNILDKRFGRTQIEPSRLLQLINLI